MLLWLLMPTVVLAHASLTGSDPANTAVLAQSQRLQSIMEDKLHSMNTQTFKETD